MRRALATVARSDKKEVAALALVVTSDFKRKVREFPQEIWRYVYWYIGSVYICMYIYIYTTVIISYYIIYHNLSLCHIIIYHYIIYYDIK